MRIMAKGILVLLVLLVRSCGSATRTFAAPIDYARDIKPLLKQPCAYCQGVLTDANAFLDFRGPEIVVDRA